MKISEKHLDKIVEIIAVFIINIAIFLISTFFVAITFWECIIYSAINALWMPFILLPALEKFIKQKSYRLTPLDNYFENFKARQDEVLKEIALEEKKNNALLTVYRYDWKLFRKHIERKGINCLYHFTDESNLPSIIETGGLFSWFYCLQNSITIQCQSSNLLSRKLDQKAGLEDYVRLSFTPDHPMMYLAIKEGRIVNPIILEIDPEVIYYKDTLFSETNATKSGVNIGQEFENFESININALFSSNYLNAKDNVRRYFQAEILVKEKVALNKVLNIKRFTLT